MRPLVSLFIGDAAAIEMDQVRQQWNHEAGYENISGTTSATLICLNRTMSNKYNMLSGRTADSDDWLEPGEQFEITLCPKEGIPPLRYVYPYVQSTWLGNAAESKRDGHLYHTAGYEFVMILPHPR